MLNNFVRKLKVGYRVVSRKPEQEPTPVRIVGPAPITIQQPVAQYQPVQIPVGVEYQPVTIPVSVEQKPISIPIQVQQPMPIKMGYPRPDVQLEGYEIPEFSTKKIKVSSLIEQKEEAVPISLSYSLIPRNVDIKDAYAYVKIYRDEKTHRYIYNVEEPKLTENLSLIFKKVKDLLEHRLDIDFSRLKRFEAIDYLHREVDDILNYFNILINDEERKAVHYYIERDFIGLGRIEPLMNDSEIEDISCDGVGIPVFIFHRNPLIASVETNIIFDDADELDSFILKLSQLCGKSISVASPLVDGALPDGSRLQATLATDIARRGSNFTIRKFTEEPLTPIHLLNYRTLDITSLAYLWLTIDYGRSILVSGGTASGKTSLLNVLSLFIRPEKKICSIEDTPELKLPHPHWVPSVARVAMTVEEGKKIGEVDMFDLLKESLRQRPDYIVVGEVRGKEAFVLFQQMATGHPSLATIHAENLPKLIDRLTTHPIDLPKTLLDSLDLIIFLMRVKYGDKHVRRISEVLEVVGIDQQSKDPITNTIFKWDPVNDRFEVSSKSIILKRISDITGLSEKYLNDELKRRMILLEWMQEKNITDYRNVYKVLNMYYTYPERVLDVIMGERR